MTSQGASIRTSPLSLRNREDLDCGKGRGGHVPFPFPNPEEASLLSYLGFLGHIPFFISSNQFLVLATKSTYYVPAVTIRHSPSPQKSTIFLQFSKKTLSYSLKGKKGQRLRLGNSQSRNDRWPAKSILTLLAFRELLIKQQEDLPGSPMIETLHFHCKGHRLHPWLGKFHILRSVAKKIKSK